MQKNDTNKVWLVSILGVLVVASGIVWYQQRNSLSSTVADSSMPQNPSAQPVASPAPQPAATPTPSATGKPVDLHRGLTYTQAVNQYKQSIQFSACHGIVGTPSNGTLSIRRGVLFMLDNRDAAAHTIAFKGASYRLKGYDFAIISAATPGTYPVTCDGGGAAQLSVN